MLELRKGSGEKWAWRCFELEGRGVRCPRVEGGQRCVGVEGEERWRGVLELKVEGRGRLSGDLNLRGKRSLLEFREETGRGGWEVWWS